MTPRALSQLERLGGFRGVIVYLASAATLSIAALVIVGWSIRSEALVELGPGLSSMKFNTAVCFAFLAAGAVLAFRGHARTALACGAFVVAIALITHVEYAFGLDAGIDRLMFEDFTPDQGVVAGRMSPITATLFMLSGTALMLVCRRPRSALRSTVAGLLTALIAGIALSALIAHVTHAPAIEVVYAWGQVTRMSLHTTFAFLLMASALGALTTDGAERRWPAWIAVAALLAGLACTFALGAALFLAESGPREPTTLLPQLVTILGAMLSVLLAIALHAARARGLQRDLLAEALAEREQALAEREQALAEREQALANASRFAAIVEASSDAIFSANLKGEIVVWNHGAERLYGYTAQEMAGQSVEVLVPKEILQEHRAMRARLREGHGTRGLRTQRIRKDGRLVHVDVSVSPIRDAHGKVIAAASIATDVTERIESERMIEGMMESAPDAIVIADAHDRIVAVNRMVEQLFGYPRADLIGQPVEVLVPGRARAVDHESAAGIPSPVGSHELAGVRRDGRQFPVEIAVSPLEMPSRTLAISVIRDITARKQAAESLRASEERLRLAIDAAGLGYWSYNLASGALRFDEICAAFYGVPASSIQRPADAAARIHPDDRDHVNETLRAAIRSGGDYHNEFRVVRDDGSIHWLLSIGRVAPAAQAPDTFTGVNLDVTRRKEAEQGLMESLHEKEVLLKEIHHRVKNNLQVVASMLSLQAEAVGDPLLEEILEECRGRVASMALVHEKLYGTDFGRIDLGQLARELTTAVVATGQRFGTSVRVEFACEPVRLDIQRAVPTALILNELLTNALKHAFAGRERGQLTVSVQRRGDGLELGVADDGVGMAAESQGGVVRNTLGMTIVRNLVRQLDAHLSVTVERGTAFRVLIPLGES